MQAERKFGVILAGGKSLRMGGGDKCLSTVADQSLLHHVINRFGPQVTDLALNANGNPERFARFGLPVLHDSVADFPGPLAGILAAMDWAASHGAASVVTVAADTPFFPDNLVTRFQQVGGLCLAATRKGNAKTDWHPTFGHWPVSLRHDMRQDILKGQRKVIDWALLHGAQAVVFDTDDDPFFNINTPDDLAEANRRTTAP
ncbi:MAG: molybdenum cofactor guanylyltransferase MobA [Paracoccaceae bacterium]